MTDTKTPSPSDALSSLFREALAWGMTYRPEIPVHQWDEMRESMVSQYVARWGTQPAEAMEIKPPNASGETQCIVRWLVETPQGWVGAWNKDALEYLLSAQPAPVREPLTDSQVRKWWERDNGLEDCNLCKLDDFMKAVRAVEAVHGITK